MHRLFRKAICALSLTAAGLTGCVHTTGWYSTISTQQPLVASRAPGPAPRPYQTPVDHDEIESASYTDLGPQPQFALPTEKFKVSFPPYVVESPDVLRIELIRAMPKGPYKIQSNDALLISATDTPADGPIAGIYRVGPDGRVNLGPRYGAVTVVELTLDQAQDAIQRHLDATAPKTKATVGLAHWGSVEQIHGEHRVRPDGTVGLGSYGAVFVAGMTLDEARKALEDHLAQHLAKPQVRIDVAAFNSKFYYVITSVVPLGETVQRFPAEGNETVLDAVAKANCQLPALARKLVWVARPAPPGVECRDQILPVNWCEITQVGNTRTNYQLLPGDRVYIQAWR